MGKFYRYGRAILALLVAVLAVGGIFGWFYPLKIFDIQLVPLLQRSLVNFSWFVLILLLGLMVLALVLGRVYCSVLCPLGLLQEAMMIIFRRKNTMHKNWPYKYFIAAVACGVLIGGSALVVRWIDPYTLFGSAATGAAIGLGALILLAVLVWFKGRWFCANICPVGAVLGLLAKKAWVKVYINQDKCVACGMCARQCPVGCIDIKNKTVDNEMCIKCMKCQGVCKFGALQLGKAPKAEPKFNAGRRRFLIGGAALLVLAAAAKSGISIAKSIGKKVKATILPAGAGNVEDFANRCLNCNLCVARCPMKIIKKADAEHPTVHLDYSEAFCNYKCHRCSKVCPSGAIKTLSLEEKRRTQIAIAQVDEDVCVKCGLCVHECPRQIIVKEEGGFPKISPDECIGCGACYNVCPVRAISMQEVTQQRLLDK